jgi:class 3 adenylate cyclase
MTADDRPRTTAVGGLPSKQSEQELSTFWSGKRAHFGYTAAAIADNRVLFVIARRGAPKQSPPRQAEEIASLPLVARNDQPSQEFNMTNATYSSLARADEAASKRETIALRARNEGKSMRAREYHYRWEWQLRSSPEALWPFVADTNRFNRDAGLPALEQLLGPGERLPNARRSLRLFRFGVPIEWEEEPFEWVYPYRYGVARRYSRGPVAEMRTLAEMTPQPGGGARLVYEVWARPKNLLGHLAIPAQIGILSARSFDKAFRRYDRLAAKDRPSSLDIAVADRVIFAPGGRERLSAARAALLSQGAPADLLNLLVELIETADDLALFRLRPYALADYWEKPRRAVLELCLWATRAGLLNFQWDVLCPLCRGAKESGDSLGQIQSRVHCGTCNIDFDVNFDRSVELVFRPNPAIRPAAASSFCVGGPLVTPHIVAQQLIHPGEQRGLPLTLAEGRYRVRALELRGGLSLAAARDGAPEAVVPARETGWPNDELRLSLAPVLHLENTTASDQLFVVERMAWSDQAATAAEVTTLQIFRDLFANEALRPGERISVGSLTILFTDLRDSTRLYRESGDAVAFGRVMTHFDVLRAAIASEDGAVVKTIGDAVMAVFLRPINALHAILKAQRELASPSDGAPPLRLKAGIHTGPCVAVTLNDRLDYFGSTVNLAARLEGLSSAHGGIVISAAVHDDPEIAAWLASGAATAEPFEAELKGFEGERFELWSVTAVR